MDTNYNNEYANSITKEIPINEKILIVYGIKFILFYTALWISFFVGLFYFYQEWHLLLISYLLYITIGVMGIEVGIHRYYSHRCFKLSKIKELFLDATVWLSSAHAPLPYSYIHRIHHLRADAPDDPHPTVARDGRLKHFVNTMLLKTDPNVGELIHWNLIVKDLLTAKHQFFMNWAIPLLFLLHVIVFLVSPVAWFYFLVVPQIIMFLTNGLTNLIGHSPTWFTSYKVVESPDISTNNIIMNFLVPGTGTHNLHHYDPTLWFLQRKWYEFDLAGYYVKLIKD